jgi:hypothetical protein
MGREAKCTARLSGQTSTGKALLETSELLFRGDFRAAIPFKAITKLVVDGADLGVTWPDGTLVLALGAPEARKWADKIRNPPSRLDKLGIKAGATVAITAVTDAGEAIGLDDFVKEAEARGARVVAGKTAKDLDLIFVTATRRSDLRGLAALKKQIRPDGAIWVLRPKGRDEITERDVMAAGKAAGLVDVKVAAFSPTLTAEKFVIPVAARAGAASTSAPRAPRATARSRRPRRSTT